MSDRQKIINEIITKTTQELTQAGKNHGKTRSWTSPTGYRFLVQWSNLVLLRILIRKFTSTFSRSEYRSKSQVDDAARSAVANIEEGYKRSTTQEYIQFIGYSQGSLEEVRGDIERFLQDGFLKPIEKSSLKGLDINLKDWNVWCRNPKNSCKLLYFPLHSHKGLYRSLKELKGQDLSYEIFSELINKTDYLL